MSLLIMWGSDSNAQRGPIIIAKVARDHEVVLLQIVATSGQNI